VPVRGVVSDSQTSIQKAVRTALPGVPHQLCQFHYLRQAARILNNEAGHGVEEVRRQYRQLWAEMARERDTVGPLAGAITHFLKVTRRHWPGLLRCYEVAGLPRTNNDLERSFRATRYHERRASGRKTADPGRVVRGAVRVPAALATRRRRFTAAELQPTRLERRRQLRQELEARQEGRRCQRRFRQAPDRYLKELEGRLLQLRLPP
jgi:hypothetical protein